MQKMNKLFVGVALVALMAACNKKDEVASVSPESDAVPAAADVKLDVPLVPSTAGVTTLDPAKLAGVSPTKAPCQLDLIAKQSVASEPAKLTVGQSALFQGWISNPSLQPPDAFAIVLSGVQAYAIRGVAGADRPDVAKVLKADGLAKSGFNVTANLDGIAPGEYSVSFIQDTSAGPIQCFTKVKATIAAG